LKRKDVDWKGLRNEREVAPRAEERGNFATKKERIGRGPRRDVEGKGSV